MDSFSQRLGITKPKAMQIESMDDDLRNSLWNDSYIYYWGKDVRNYDENGYNSRPIILTMMNSLWMYYFKQKIDDLQKRRYHKGSYYRDFVKDYFFKCEWYQVYDLLEYVVSIFPIKTHNEQFIQLCNSTLEREFSAYRFIEGKITAITSEIEIAEIEEAISNDVYSSVSSHLKRALELFSDKQNPDYRNSIKESISAVESMCKGITGKPNVDLNEALKSIKNKNIIDLHSQFEEALKKLYNYTSDEKGIRHALMEETAKVDFAEAKFMLVSCSAFVNYLQEKSLKAEIDLTS